MNYDAIIIELLSRIQVLEEKVAQLEGDQNQEKVYAEKEETEMKKVSMTEIRRHIITMKEDAARRGESYIIITASEIHNAMELSHRYPMVCNAMRQTMGEDDEVLFSPPSGYSSTLKIKYYLDEV